ncbi:DUF3916 domain-containing protein [Pseudomonas fluorescens]|uniref:DUF3916 domain-containing protein n=1 Tax=Pseudomonas TaxID=286 RepID=UPI003CFF6261
MRRIAFSNKKVRNIPRRLRALAAWAASYEGYFPDELPVEQGYANRKIPVLETLVEGKQTTFAIQKECAQQLINAAHHLLQARPEDTINCRIVASILTPDMFSSEICIYTDMSRYRGHVLPFDYEHFCQTRITDKSLATEWGLIVPAEMNEVGFHFVHEDEDGQKFESEHWYFGEVDEADDGSEKERWRYKTFKSFRAENPELFG